MRKFLLAIIIMLLAPMYLSAARLKVYLREKDPNKKRELVMKPDVWYDTDERVIDVFMNSTGMLTVYYEDGVTVYNVVNLSFDLNRVFCDKGCNLIILETADGVVYEGYLQGEVEVK